MCLCVEAEGIARFVVLPGRNPGRAVAAERAAFAPSCCGDCGVEGLLCLMLSHVLCDWLMACEYVVLACVMS